MGKVGTSGGSSLDFVWPVGSLYSTLDAGFDPNVYWGGTWVKIEENCTIRQANKDHPMGSQFGEAEVSLTEENNGPHGHKTWFAPGDGSTPGGFTYTEHGQRSSTLMPGSTYIEYSGKGTPHNNIGPSLAANIWQRTK